MLRLLVVSLLFTLRLSAATPPRVIFDTDIGNDIDDALALAMLHTMESHGEAKLIGVTITKDHPNAAKLVDIINTYYGRGAIPIGVVRNGKTPNDSPMLSVPVHHAPPYAATNRPTEDAVALLERLLKKQKDGSVVIAQVGFFTNLARLLDQPGAKALIRRKVKLLSMMAGAFPDGKPEYNVKIDIPAARKVFDEWPTQIVASGYEIGTALLYPAKAIEAMPAANPVAEAYRSYQKFPYDRPTWDLTAVLYGVRPGDMDFRLSAAGTITVDDTGKTLFRADEKGRCRYLILDAAKRAAVLQQLVELAGAARK